MVGSTDAGRDNLDSADLYASKKSARLRRAKKPPAQLWFEARVAEHIYFALLRELLMEGDKEQLDGFLEHAPRFSAVVSAARAEPPLRRHILMQGGCKHREARDGVASTARWAWWTPERLAQERASVAYWDSGHAV